MVVVWSVCVGLIAGWATGKIMRGAGYGALAWTSYSESLERGSSAAGSCARSALPGRAA